MFLYEPSSLPTTACYQSSPLTAVILQSWFTEISLGHLVYRYSFTVPSRPPSFFHISISSPSQRLFYRYSFIDPSCPPSFFHISISSPSQRLFYRYSFTDPSRPPSFFLRSPSCPSQRRFFRYLFTHRSRPRSHILVQHFTLNNRSRSSANGYLSVFVHLAVIFTVSFQGSVSTSRSSVRPSRLPNTIIDKQ